MNLHMVAVATGLRFEAAHSDRSVTVLIYVAHVRSQLTRGRTASTVTRGRPRPRRARSTIAWRMRRDAA
jgi:hypothetical protein